jgi:hypothetical protein
MKKENKVKTSKTTKSRRRATHTQMAVNIIRRAQ